MATRVSIGLSGADAALAKIRAYGAKKRGEFEAIIATSALEIESDAKALAPVDSGRLRASIRANFENRLKVTVGTPVEYAPFVEFGTVRQRAQPFLIPAIEANRERFIRNLKAAIYSL